MMHNPVVTEHRHMPHNRNMTQPSRLGIGRGEGGGEGGHRWHICYDPLEPKIPRGLGGKRQESLR